jgi:hypothetical protein
MFFVYSYIYKYIITIICCYAHPYPPHQMIIIEDHET